MPKIVNYLYESGLSAYALDFLESSKMSTYEAAQYGQRLNAIMGSPFFMDQIASHTPELGCLETVGLPTAEALPTAAAGLAALNGQRRSTRHFAAAGLNLAEVGQLLRLAYAITVPAPAAGGLPPTRNIASGGGLYPVDLYYVSRRTVGLAPGVYHYHLGNDALERLPGPADPADLERQVNAAFFTDQKADMDYANVSGYFVLGGVLNRVRFKYLDRGLRFALLDAGALTHSIYLASTALRIGCCGMGSYDDELTNQLIGFRGSAQWVLGVVVIGKKHDTDA